MNRGQLSIASEGDPSFDAGRLVIQGDFRQLPTGLLKLDLFSNGGVAGLNFDQLAVTGKAKLGGVLDISAPNPGLFAEGNAFPIITASGGLTGLFSNLIAPALNGGLVWAVEYTSTAALLKVVAQGNGDPTGYLAQWRQSVGIDDLADLNGDLRTDGADFLIWQQGGAASPPMAVAAFGAVPEPSSASLALAALAVVGPWRRRRTPCADQPK